MRVFIVSHWWLRPVVALVVLLTGALVVLLTGTVAADHRVAKLGRIVDRKVVKDE